MKSCFKLNSLFACLGALVHGLQQGRRGGAKSLAMPTNNNIGLREDVPSNNCPGMGYTSTAELTTDKVLARKVATLARLAIVPSTLLCLMW